uniref:Ig-like domain-containing protein n=1 Tax=Myripristis murdjan TaxID=586833 RepID=A0A667WMT0_9TELE
PINSVLKILVRFNFHWFHWFSSYGLHFLLSHVIGSPQPIVALAGDDVVLPCRLEPAVSDFSGTVEWTKEGLSPPFVHVHKSGGQVVQSQNPLYKYRTVLFVDELKNGNVSLKLFRATVSDEGTYLCFIPSIRKGDFIQLTVGELVSAASSPVITVSESISGVTLECESKGWYPKPELLWLDAEGELLSAGAPETVRGPDGLYTVSSRTKEKCLQSTSESSESDAEVERYKCIVNKYIELLNKTKIVLQGNKGVLERQLKETRERWLYSARKQRETELTQAMDNIDTLQKEIDSDLE